MEFPAAAPSPATAWRRRAPGVLAALALAAYALLLIGVMDPYAAGSDTSGYLNHARLLASGHVHAPMRVIEGLPPATAPYDIYTPLGLKPAPDGNGLVPTYPIGLPLFIAVAARLVGWTRAPGAVMLIHALLGVLLTYALGRRVGLPPGWASFGAVAIAASPLYILYSIQPMSDVPSLVWVLAAVLAASRADRGAAWSVASGAALSVAVLIRPTNLLALLPVAMILGLSPKRWAALAAGALPAAALFGLHARAAYGSAFATGYGDNSYSFSRSYAGITLFRYARRLPKFFTPIVIAALGLPWARPPAGRPRWRGVLGVWILVWLGFYAFYQFTHETWWYLRFILPAAPALVVGGLLALRRWLPRGVRGTVLAAALVLALGNGAWWTRHYGVLNTRRHDMPYPEAMGWLQAHLPANAIVAAWQASGALFYYTPLTYFRWERLDADSFGRITAAAAAARRPIYAALFPNEVGPALSEHMRGPWSLAGEAGGVTIWKWNGGASPGR